MTTFEESYDSKTVDLLDQVFADACAHAASRVVMDEGIRTMLASAVLEGAKLGLRERDDVLRFALRAIPAFREREAQL
ncbi:hypothetical protein [Ancylobacter mangrovi]|uniref:hypothetical protein n=1 Tax=Ancylobacter mangrovi TaxID=2972472 RepID=UPI00216386D5|nr:hypothetical protein [Ancylobacter mangrovi]MCS0503596.1 hypothetical protein [Ancylobacter mangrovi]